MSTDEKTASDTELDDVEAQDAETQDALAKAEIEAERAAEAALEAQAAHKRTIGLERWVQLGFMAAAILFVWLFDHLITAIWYIFADPNEAVATGLAVIAGIVAAGAAYSNKSAYGLVHGVSEELTKVTWPTRKETSSSTMVVVVTSIVAALMLFLFDSVWSAVTDLVYKV